MSLIRDRILEYLSRHPEGATDGELAAALGLKSHQQANRRCRQLAAQRRIVRQRVGARLRNFLAGAGVAPPPAQPVPGVPSSERPAGRGCTSEQPWF